MNCSDSSQRRRVYLPEELEFRAATVDDEPFLYRLLVERYAKGTVNIPDMASAVLPSFDEHVAHLRAARYARMEIVEVEGTAAGMLYLTRENVVGCFVLRDYASRGLGLAACYRFFQDCAYPVIAHLSAHNRAGWRTAQRLGFVQTEALPHRWTMELRGAPLDPFREVRLGRRIASAH